MTDSQTFAVDDYVTPDPEAALNLAEGETYRVAAVFEIRGEQLLGLDAGRKCLEWVWSSKVLPFPG
jgi:hypothetical protein